MLIHGDCLQELKKLSDNSIDSLVTDPPSGISFMNKSWDSDKGGRDEWIAWMTEVMRECQRVLKPGAHALIWAIPRTSHWTTTAVENAGFEVRDVVTHLFGSGFPKSLDISKAIDKEAGARFITAPATDEAKQWQGFGTALKPAAEFWILARKPISEKTVAKNVLKWGTGGLNIDGSRIGYQTQSDLEYAKSGAHRRVKSGNENGTGGWKNTSEVKIVNDNFAQGRFPANLVFSHTEWCTDEICDIECAIKRLHDQTEGTRASKPRGGKTINRTFKNCLFKPGTDNVVSGEQFNDPGGVSRFFYCAKASTNERNAGLEEMPEKKLSRSNGAKGAESRNEEYRMDMPNGLNRTMSVKNNHPTVKPQKLMQYLIKLITPPGGIVLDPFMGSGSTGLACKTLGFQFIGIEKEKEYFEISEKRLEALNV